MRILFAFALLFWGLNSSTLGQKSHINWMSVEEVTEAMKSDPRPVMMDVYTHWCGPCKMMKANTFTNPNVIEYINENYYAIMFDAEYPNDVVFKGNTYSNPSYDPNKRGRNGVHTLSRALKVSAYPTIVYFDEKFNVITAKSGYKDAKGMERYLRFFNEVYSKDIPKEEIQTVWDNYNSNFTPTW